MGVLRVSWLRVDAHGDFGESQLMGGPSFSGENDDMVPKSSLRKPESGYRLPHS